MIRKLKIIIDFYFECIQTIWRRIPPIFKRFHILWTQDFAHISIDGLFEPIGFGPIQWCSQNIWPILKLRVAKI